MPDTIPAPDDALCLAPPEAGAARPAHQKEWHGSPEAAATRIGLTRRPFFKWIEKGRTHSDPLPATTPAAVPAWYDRMKARGEFKHRLPDSVREACAKVTPSSDTPSDTATTAAAVTSRFSDTASAELQSLRFEAQDIQRHLARLRHATETSLKKATPEGDDEAQRRVFERTQLLDKLSLISARIMEQEEKDGLLIKRTEVEQDFAAIFPPTMEYWLQAGASFHSRSKSALTRVEFMEHWRAIVTTVCRQLASSKFAPPMALVAAA